VEFVEKYFLKDYEMRKEALETAQRLVDKKLKG
jgi:hypothetical protein